MGLLDGLIGDVLGSALGGGNQRQDPLGSVLGGLAGGSQAQSGNLLLQLALSLLQQNGGLEESSAGSVKAAWGNKQIPG
jgi:hypothetical protein